MDLKNGDRVKLRAAYRSTSVKIAGRYSTTRRLQLLGRNWQKHYGTTGGTIIRVNERWCYIQWDNGRRDEVPNITIRKAGKL